MPPTFNYNRRFPGKPPRIETWTASMNGGGADLYRPRDSPLAPSPDGDARSAGVARSDTSSNNGSSSSSSNSNSNSNGNGNHSNNNNVIGYRTRGPRPSQEELSREWDTYNQRRRALGREDERDERRGRGTHQGAIGRMRDRYGGDRGGCYRPIGEPHRRHDRHDRDDREERNYRDFNNRNNNTYDRNRRDFNNGNNFQNRKPYYSSRFNPPRNELLTRMEPLGNNIYDTSDAPRAQGPCAPKDTHPAPHPNGDRPNSEANGGTTPRGVPAEPPLGNRPRASGETDTDLEAGAGPRQPLWITIPSQPKPPPATTAPSPTISAQLARPATPPVPSCNPLQHDSSAAHGNDVDGEPLSPPYTGLIDEPMNMQADYHEASVSPEAVNDLHQAVKATLDEFKFSVDNNAAPKGDADDLALSLEDAEMRDASQEARLADDEDTHMQDISHMKDDTHHEQDHAHTTDDTHEHKNNDLKHDIHAGGDSHDQGCTQDADRLSPEEYLSITCPAAGTAQENELLSPPPISPTSPCEPMLSPQVEPNGRHFADAGQRSQSFIQRIMSRAPPQGSSEGRVLQTSIVEMKLASLQGQKDFIQERKDTQIAARRWLMQMVAEGKAQRASGAPAGPAPRARYVPGVAASIHNPAASLGWLLASLNTIEEDIEADERELDRLEVRIKKAKRQQVSCMERTV